MTMLIYISYCPLFKQSKLEGYGNKIVRMGYGVEEIDLFSFLLYNGLYGMSKVR